MFTMFEHHVFNVCGFEIIIVKNFMSITVLYSVQCLQCVFVDHKLLINYLALDDISVEVAYGLS